MQISPGTPIGHGCRASSRIQTVVLSMGRPIETPPELTDAAIAPLPTGPVPPGLDDLLYRSPDGKYAFRHGREWHLFAEDTRQSVLKWLDHGELVQHRRRDVCRLPCLRELCDDLRVRPDPPDPQPAPERLRRGADRHDVRGRPVSRERPGSRVARQPELDERLVADDGDAVLVGDLPDRRTLVG